MNSSDASDLSHDLSSDGLSWDGLSSDDPPTRGLSAEIVIVGAGMAGAALAVVLGRQGRRVIVVDPHSNFPPLFRAEKIERQQVVLLRKLGLLELLLPYGARVSEVRAGYDGRFFRTSPIEQYGIEHAEMVNALRAQKPAGVEYRLGRVEHIVNSSGVQRVKLSGGQELTCRLVVIASGVNSELLANLGIHRRVIQKDQSLGFGFDISASDERPFDFDALTYYSFSPSTRIDYLTLFKFRETMRANLFVFRSANDSWVREFIQDPDGMLRRSQPKLSRLIGEYRVSSSVDSGRVDLYKSDGHNQAGVVLIGDAFQSACPAFGMGLDKVLTDVDVLSECIPRWLASPGMSTNKLVEFYTHPRKSLADSRAIEGAQNHRRVVTEQSVKWQGRRLLLHLKWRLLGAIWPLRQFRIPVVNVPTSNRRTVKSETAGW